MKKLEGNRKDWIKNILIVFLIILLNPVAPHITEELWSVLGHSDSISYNIAVTDIFFQYDYELFACRGIEFIHN